MRPVAFGRRCRIGNEVRLHSHLGKGFAGDWAINKNCHMLFGTLFVWVTDCYAIRYILLYNGNNPAVLQLQMRLMCWDMDIVHRNNIYLTDADYCSRLGEDICYDSCFKSYLDFDCGLRKKFPTPVNLHLLPENMPYYRGPGVVPPSTNEQTTDVHHCQSLFSQVMTHNSNGICHLSVNPVTLGKFGIVTPSDGHVLTNYQFPCDAQQVLRFSWAVYSFGGGHFASTILLRSLPFCVKLACDQYDFGHALFREFTQCTQIFDHGKDIFHHIRSSGNCSQIHSHLIHSLWFWDSRRLHNSGNSKRPLWLSFVPFTPFRWLLRLLSLTMMANVSSPSPPPSN